jgi:hypothetical protein
MNANGRRVQARDSVFHLGSGTALGGRWGTVIKSDDPYFCVEFDEPLEGRNKKPKIHLHWSHIEWKPKEKKSPRTKTG